jgi:hypothetical protein
MGAPDAHVPGVPSCGGKPGHHAMKPSGGLAPPAPLCSAGFAPGSRLEEALRLGRGSASPWPRPSSPRGRDIELRPNGVDHLPVQGSQPPFLVGSWGLGGSDYPPQFLITLDFLRHGGSRLGNECPADRDQTRGHKQLDIHEGRLRLLLRLSDLVDSCRRWGVTETPHYPDRHDPVIELSPGPDEAHQTLVSDFPTPLLDGEPSLVSLLKKGPSESQAAAAEAPYQCDPTALDPGHVMSLPQETAGALRSPGPR